MAYKIQSTSQNVNTFHYNPETKEFTFAESLFVPAGTGLPAHSTNTIPPEVEDGKVLVFDEKTEVWSQMENHRGKIVYDILSGQPINITELGPMPTGITSVPSPVIPLGHTAIFNVDTKQWVVVEDNRGVIVYDKKTKESSEIKVVGPIPEGKTVLTPPYIEKGFESVWNEERGGWEIFVDRRGEVMYDVRSGDKFVIEELGTPASNLTPVEPPEVEEGFARVYDFENHVWVVLENHIGETIYNKADGSSETVTSLGAINENFTTIAPTSPFDKWDGEAWVKDEDAEKAFFVEEATEKKALLLSQINSELAILADAIDLEIATEEESERYNSLRKQRVMVSRIDPNNAPDITWPEEE